MNANAKPLSEIVTEIEPLVKSISHAQGEWLVAMRAKAAQGPYNEETLIALVAVAEAFARAMGKSGYPDDYIQYVISVGTKVSEGVSLSALTVKGMDA